MEPRIVFMGTPEFGVPVLEELARSPWEMVAVYTRPDRPAGRGQHMAPSPVKRVALELGFRVIEPSTMRGQGSAVSLAEFRPDVVVVAAFAYLLPREVLAVPRLGCLNVHPSLLPRHRGPSPVAAALLRGDAETGVSIMLMDEGLDTGPVLSQEALSISEADTTGSLTEALSEMGARLLRATIGKWIEGDLVPRPQDESLATSSELIRAKDAGLDWSLPAVELWRQVRAYHPWPGCYTTWEGKRLKILSGRAIRAQQRGEVGRVVELPDTAPNRIGVVTGDGVLGLGEVQLEGKRQVSVEELVRGHGDFIGSSLVT
ncbi:MAG: methionyl-tRNA formyltransferase [Chloroflexi bacterium]|nr:methionyl-tRNA formyltransferase [Chloroflexota bacterium]